MSSPFGYAQDKLRRDIWILTKLAFRTEPDPSARLRLGRDDKAFRRANKNMYPLLGRRNPLIRKQVNVPNNSYNSLPVFFVDVNYGTGISALFKKS